MTVFTYKVLGNFKRSMYGNLVYKNNIIKNNAKRIEYTECGGQERSGYQYGYFIRKDEHKLYVLKKNHYDLFPLKIKEEREILLTDNNVAYMIDKPVSFKVVPEHIYDFNQLCTLDDIEHSEPNQFLFWKIACNTAYASRIVTRNSSNKRFGKDGYLTNLNLLYDNVNIVTPESPPGFHHAITPNGILVLNEIGGVKKDIIMIIQKGILGGMGDMKDSYYPGKLGSAQHDTKSKYDIHNMSLMCLYNNLGHYKNPDKFFDNLFTNSAVYDRTYPLNFSGTIGVSQFRHNNPAQICKDNYDMFRGMIKSMAWYCIHWRELVDYDWVNKTNLSMTSKDDRWGESKTNLLEGISIFSKDEVVRTKLANVMYECHKSYMRMIQPLKEEMNVLGVKDEEEVN